MKLLCLLILVPPLSRIFSTILLGILKTITSSPSHLTYVILSNSIVMHNLGRVNCCCLGRNFASFHPKFGIVCIRNFHNKSCDIFDDLIFISYSKLENCEGLNTWMKVSSKLSPSKLWLLIYKFDFLYDS